MKINVHNLPAAPAATAPAATAPAPTASSRSSAALPQVKSTAETAFSARPVRISRFPEEAALFAYSRNATLPPPPKPSQIDEYV